MPVPMNNVDPSDRQPAGYLPSMRQPCRALHFRIALPPAMDLAGLDQTLVQRFHAELDSLRSEVSTADPALLAAVQLTWRAMLLARCLLQAIKVPSFDPGVIIDARRDPEDEGHGLVSCLLPAIDEIPSHWSRQCMKLAYTLLLKLADPALPEQAATALLDELGEKFIAPAARQMPSGDSTVPVLEAAHRLRIPFRHLGAGLYQLGWGAGARLLDRSACERDSALGALVSHNKQTAAIVLHKAGLPTPQHIRARDVAQAWEAARSLGFPVVVKPADKEQGEGVTMDVVDEAGLKVAFEAAARVSAHVLVERQVPGACHRFFVVGNDVLYVVARLPVLVDGDGIQSVRDLIAHENATESRKATYWRKTWIAIDEDVESRLAEQGLGLDSVPVAGQRVMLRRTESSDWGGTPELVTAQVHPDNLQIAIRAARLLRLHVAGIDLISQDIGRPWHENQAIINEVNYAPLIQNYYDYQRDSLDHLVGGMFSYNPRIPIEVFVGDNAALIAAKKRQQAMAARGRTAFMTTHRQSWAGTQAVALTMATESLFGRCLALLTDQGAEALLIVLQTDEFLSSGMPVDKLDRVTVINDRLLSHDDPTRRVAASDRRRLLQLLASMRRKHTGAASAPSAT